MINALHLLWIVPLSVFSGFMYAAMLMVADAADGGMNDEQ
jgi:hypothetical protein